MIIFFTTVDSIECLQWMHVRRKGRAVGCRNISADARVARQLKQVRVVPGTIVR